MTEDPVERFKHELALELGFPDPDEMLEQMTPEQWEKWKIFGRIRPFGDRRADLRNVLLAMAIDLIFANAGGVKPILDMKLFKLMLPFDDIEADQDDGWEDPMLTFEKLRALSMRAQR